MKDTEAKRAYNELPEGYYEVERIDLSGNKRQSLTVTLLSLVLLVAMIGLGFLIAPSYARADGGLNVALRIGAIGLGCVAYLVGHEAVHGLVMWRISRVKPRFGFTLKYAYAGSDVYFAKTPYLIIALAPFVLWGAALTLLCALVPPQWFWAAFVIQAMNVSGSAGDLYVAARVIRMPGSVLIQDPGTAMRVCDKCAAQSNIPCVADEEGAL